MSKSILRNVVIEHAGMGPGREVLPAIRSYKVPPRIDQVLVKNNAYTGYNVTLPSTFVQITGSSFINNAGKFKLLINTLIFMLIIKL